MRLSVEEMMILSEKLEKEQEQYRQMVTRDPNDQSKQRLYLISQLQTKLKDLQADLDSEEQSFLMEIIQEEMNQIHGHGTGIYYSILKKVKQ